MWDRLASPLTWRSPAAPARRNFLGQTRAKTTAAPSRDDAAPASPRAASPPICLTACCAAAVRSTNSSTRRPSSRRWKSATARSPRALVGTVLRRLGTLASPTVAAARTRSAAAGASRRDRAPSRRRANSVSRRARPCRGRSFGAAGAGRPLCGALCRSSSMRCCGVSRVTAKPRSLRSTCPCSIRPTG